jgi:hypothetical protein
MEKIRDVLSIYDHTHVYVLALLMIREIELLQEGPPFLHLRGPLPRASYSSLYKKTK